MDIEKLQGELVEKILLIPVEDDSEAIGREALEIINELKDHINDDIVVGNNGDKRFTALDCVIIVDSQGDSLRVSERPRINNRILKELENAIRDVGGKTSEELGIIQNVSCSQSEFQEVAFAREIQALVQREPEIRALARASGERIRVLEQASEQASGQELRALEQRIQELQDLSQASEQGLRILGETLEQGPPPVQEIQRLRALVQASEQNMQALAQALERELEISRDLSLRTIRETICTLFTLTLSVGSLYLAYQSRNDQGFSMSKLIAIGTGAAATLVRFREPLRELISGVQERQASTDLENATVQPSVEERQLALD